MIKHFKTIGRLRTSVGTLAIAALPLVGGVAACNKDDLLEAVDPDVIDPTDINSAEGALALYVGALGRLRQATGGTSVGSGGEGSSWLFGGLLADEWSTSSTFVQNDETDLRAIQINNGTGNTMFRQLARARTSATESRRD